jgi:triphosphatase
MEHVEAAERDSPHKASPVEVVRGVDVSKLAQAALASCCEQIRLNLPGAKRGEDPAFTHQLRVGTRRLRVALRMFAARLDPEQVTWLEGELKWVFGQLGAQRELDVMLHDTLDRLGHGSAALEALRASVEQERARRHQQVKDTLNGRRFKRLARALADLPSTVHADERRAKKWVRKQLGRRRDATLARYEPALTGDPEQRHQLRKQFKKLRYASELCSALFKAKRVKRYLGAIEDVQDVLGELNDVATGRAELARLSTGRQVELGSALEACELHFAEREGELLGKLAPVLRAHAEARPFWG